MMIKGKFTIVVGGKKFESGHGAKVTVHASPFKAGPQEVHMIMDDDGGSVMMLGDFRPTTVDDLRRRGGDGAVTLADELGWDDDDRTVRRHLRRLLSDDS